jgi:hypothetical protein
MSEYIRLNGSRCIRRLYWDLHDEDMPNDFNIFPRMGTEYVFKDGSEYAEVENWDPEIDPAEHRFFQRWLLDVSPGRCRRYYNREIEKFCQRFHNRLGTRVIKEYPCRFPYFLHCENCIRIPPAICFANEVCYYATLLHEWGHVLVHHLGWTLLEDEEEALVELFALVLIRMLTHQYSGGISFLRSWYPQLPAYRECLEHMLNWCQ